MKRLIIVVLLLAFPGGVFGLEQSFTQQGIKATIKLSPDTLKKNAKVQLSLRLDQNGTRIVDRDVRLSVYRGGSNLPIIVRSVERLDDEYIDSWQFDEPGDYRIVVDISALQKADGALQYELHATVPESGHDHGLFSHHFCGGKRGWWGTGIMMIMMVSMMIIVL